MELNRSCGVIPFYYNEVGDIKMCFMLPSGSETPWEGQHGSDDGVTVMYQIAKGSMESGETEWECALREGKEEIGLFEGNVDDHWQIPTKFVKGTLTLFVCKVKDPVMFGDPLDKTEVVGTRWMTVEEFDQQGRQSQRHIVKSAYSTITKQCPKHIAEQYSQEELEAV